MRPTWLPDLLLHMNLPANTPPATLLARKLVRLAREYSTVEAQYLDAVGNGSAQHALLELIVAIPGLCMTAASERLAVDKSAITRAVRQLEWNGYVERLRSRRDRRVWELHPTRRAGMASWVARPCELSPAARLFAGFSDEDLGRLREYMGRMEANLKVTPAEVVRRAVWDSGTSGPAHG